jgi:hypothetical protein
MSDAAVQIVAVGKANAHHVGKVIRSVYGEDFPAKAVYQPEVLCKEIEAGRLIAALAFTQDGRPVGYISAFKSAPNFRLWEAGALVVDPAFASANLASLLPEYCFSSPMKLMADSDGLISEAVCCHYFSQVSVIKSGLVDCALLLDQLSGDSFKDGRSNRSETARVSCVLNFKEFTNPAGTEYLPARYAQRLRQLAAPLRPRTFVTDEAPLPVAGITRREDFYFASAQTWKVTVRSIGADWAAVIAQILAEADKRRVISLQVTLDTACPSIGAAVESLREQGFFFGGLIPRWFGTDGLLMQKLLDDEPEFEKIKLYSPTAQALLDYIRADRATVGSAGRSF